MPKSSFTFTSPFNFCCLCMASGNYDGFEKILQEHTKQAIKRYEANKKRRDEVQAFIDKFRCNAKRASLVQSRIKVRSFVPCCVLKTQQPKYQTTKKVPKTTKL